MKVRVFEGIIPPLVTPFNRDGTVDEKALRAVIRYVLDGGVHGVFIAGSTGEAYALEDKERLKAFEVALDEVNGKVPVFAGTAQITTEGTIRLTKAAESLGVDAVSIVTPFFITPLVTGGKGAVPASGNVAPELIVNLYNAVKRGDLQAARAFQFQLAPLRNAFSLGSFPVVLKEALNLIGIPVGTTRLPIQH
jgi:dihydrodipicolinate synthase/N-acetylneuraminate lyase